MILKNICHGMKGIRGKDKLSCDLKGKTALVTGANRGIGKAIVECFLKNDVEKIYAAVRNPHSVSALLEQHAGRLIPLQLDLSVPETIKAAAAMAKDVQIVVNNAGVLQAASPMADDAIDSLDYQMKINVYGLIRMAQAFAPILKANGGGAFVQLNSIASLRCSADLATYCASKAAAYSITQALRELLARQCTLVVSVHPGPIATDMAAKADCLDIAEPPSIVAEGIVSALKAGRFHLFAGTIAGKMEKAYRCFSKNVIEAEF